MSKKWKNVLIVLLSICLNCMGRYLAQSMNMPIWFDMTGTFVASYFTGLWGGIIAGISNNLIAAIYDPAALAYTIISVAAALIICFFIKKGYLNHPFRAIVACFWMGIICTLISTPINLIFYNGYSGNYWGDTLVDMLRWYEVSDFVSALAGEAIVEIVDKQVCVLAACVIIYVSRNLTSKKKNKATQALSLLLAVGMVGTIAVQTISLEAEAVGNSDENFVEKIYNNTNGMVSSEANVICETADGCMWIGSYAGLSRYDGSEFEFVLEGGLVNVVGMMTDSHGRLWIGTNDAGIARYENGEYTYFTTENGLPTNSVRCFAEDSQGNVYVGTSDKMCMFAPDDAIEMLDNDISFAKDMVVYNDIIVVMDNNGDIYALDGDKTVKLDDKNDEVFYYCIADTSEGLMVGTESGELYVVQYDDGAFSIRKNNINADRIAAIMEDSEGRIWIAMGSAFGYLDADGNFNEMRSTGFDSSFTDFHEDYQGNIWLASSNYGVMKLSESSFMNMFESNGVEGEVVNAAVEYDGFYFCGTDNGLLVFDNNGLTDRYSELTAAVDGSRVRSLFVDSKNKLWLCTYNGLFCFDKQDGIRCYNVANDNTTSDRFRCITELEDGTIVTGTADGINFISDGKVTVTLTADDGLENTQILSVVESKDGIIWAGSDGSGIYVIADGKLEKVYNTESGLSSNVILRIVPYENGYLVVTSNSLCHIDLDGEIKKLSNFPYFNNYDVIIDGEMAYIPCSAGLYEVKLSELCEDKAKCKLYGANEGLFSGLTANSWNYVADDGRIFLCSNGGVVIFNNAVSQEYAEMKYGIISVECDGEKLSLSADNSINLPENAQDLSIYASVRNYAFTDVKVQFYIDELEKSPKSYSWNEIEPIRLFKPDSAEYNICMRILDASGDNVISEKVYTVYTVSHPWEKPAFIAYLYFVCAEAIIFAVFSILSFIFFVLRKDELEKIQIELERKVKVQTEELVEKQKTIKELFVQTVTALSEAVDAKDRYTSGHSKRVAEYARMIAVRMGKSKEEQEEIYRAGLLHDVGKIRIPVEIINKAGRLTDQEFNIIKVHPVTGYHILRGISGNRPIAIAAKYHHERYDGKGYPNGLEGDKIPETARILGVADSYDAMTSNRSYRQALPQAVVRSEIEKGRGTQFDPEIADIMLQMIDEDTEYTMKQADWMQRKILAVDDEKFNHKVIESIMRDEPMYEIVCAKSGKEALKLLSKQEFNLILLDVMMPDMDGIEVLREIRKKYSTPVVLMTADKTLDTSTEFAAYGCDDYITKPFLPLLLKEVIHNMTERTTIEE